MMCVAWQLAWFHMAVTARVDCKEMYVCLPSVNVHVRKSRYSNHTAVGGAIHKVLKEAKINREDLWITSKVYISLEVCVYELELCIVAGVVVCKRVRAIVCAFAESLLFVELLILF